MAKRPKKNPVPPSSEVQKDLSFALYQKFTGHEKREVIHYDAPKIPDEMTLRGVITAIEYDTVRDNTREYYRHEFRPDSRPVFLADRNLFVIAGGSYRFTPLGIVDVGEKITSIQSIDKPKYPKAVLFVGMCYALQVLLAGRRRYYRFKSRPALVASYDGNQLFLLGGAYNFT
jgi:hypothetical protein